MVVIPSFASAYNVSSDTEILEVPEIYYTEDYEPGVITALREQGIELYAMAAYGSYSQSGFTPYVSYTTSGSNSKLVSLVSSDPSVSVSSSAVTATYSNFIGSSTLESGMLFFSLANNTYFDFQSSDFAFTQDSAKADTFILNGTLSFQLQNTYTVNQSSALSFYGALDPIAVQLLVDGQPYGDIVAVSSYTSPFTSAFTGTPAYAYVTFDNLKVYGVESAPELIGFRVYVDSDYIAGTRSLTANQALTSITVANTLRTNAMPTISYVEESADTDYSGDLSSIIALLADTNGGSWLMNIFNYGLSMINGGSYLYQNGNVASTTSALRLPYLLSQGFLGLRSLLTVSSGQQILSSSGSIATISGDYTLSHLIRTGFLGLRNYTEWHFAIPDNSNILNSNGSVAVSNSNRFVNLVRLGFLGLSQNIKDFNSYLADSTFTWNPFDLTTGTLADTADTATGQNEFMQDAFQSIEDKLGRLAYVFANDEEIALKQEAEESTDAFRENFGGGVSVSDISDMADISGSVKGWFDFDTDIGDLFDVVNGSGTSDWFSQTTKNNLDSVVSIQTYALDDDPYNMQDYYDFVDYLMDEYRGDSND